MREHFKQNRRLLIAIGVVGLLAFLIANVEAVEFWKQKTLTISGVAGETLVVGDVACIAAADGLVYKADADSSTRRPAVGVISKGGTATHGVQITVIGILAGQTAASPGARIFLSTGAGVITTTAPTNAQPLGWVLPGTTSSSTTYFINVVTPSSAGAGY
jgi:hypothetical protein